MSITKEMHDRLVWLENNGMGDTAEAKQLRDVLDGKQRYPIKPKIVSVYPVDTRIRNDLINLLQDAGCEIRAKSISRIEVVGVPNIIAYIKGVSFIMWRDQ